MSDPTFASRRSPVHGRRRAWSPPRSPSRSPPASRSRGGRQRRGARPWPPRPRSTSPSPPPPASAATASPSTTRPPPAAHRAQRLRPRAAALTLDLLRRQGFGTGATGAARRPLPRPHRHRPRRMRRLVRPGRPARPARPAPGPRARHPPRRGRLSRRAPHRPLLGAGRRAPAPPRPGRPRPHHRRPRARPGEIFRNPGLAHTLQLVAEGARPPSTRARSRPTSPAPSSSPAASSPRPTSPRTPAPGTSPSAPSTAASASGSAPATARGSPHSSPSTCWRGSTWRISPPVAGAPPPADRVHAARVRRRAGTSQIPASARAPGQPAVEIVRTRPPQAHRPAPRGGRPATRQPNQWLRYCLPLGGRWRGQRVLLHQQQLRWLRHRDRPPGVRPAGQCRKIRPERPRLHPAEPRPQLRPGRAGRRRGAAPRPPAP